MDKNYKVKVYVLLTSIALIIVSILGYTYSYFAAVVTENNKTETQLKSNVLGLEFEGLTEINIEDIVPGDSMTKTFTVKNISSHEVDFNIYMQAITNEFNSDLVYSLKDGSTEVVAETALPVTNDGKSYILSKESIAKDETKTYTLTIKLLYKADEDQNMLQGKSFKATLGIDSNKNTYAVAANEIEFTSEYTECTDVNCSVNELYDLIVGE